MISTGRTGDFQFTGFALSAHRNIQFEIGDYISVTLEDGKLIIAQDTERAALKAAEEEFMEREMKNLQKRYEAEKRALRAQMVAEPGARW